MNEYYGGFLILIFFKFDILYQNFLSKTFHISKLKSTRIDWPENYLMIIFYLFFMSVIIWKFIFVDSFTSSYCRDKQL